MRLIGNILWIIFGGLLSALGWLITGVLWCITIIGIPVGLQCFKLASLSLNPFGKEVKYEGGAGSFLLNVLWIIFGGLVLAIGNFLCGVLWCITIIGIPFGKQFFKLAGLSLRPFGATVVREKYL
ncbi:MAG: YccF domain-containing protein [Lachnospiraceae bacterium]|nr:YccF domain-containing protein [Lachnospiraceae bacterium]